jgi:hypothetical protein
METRNDTAEDLRRFPLVSKNDAADVSGHIPLVNEDDAVGLVKEKENDVVSSGTRAMLMYHRGNSWWYNNHGLCL